MEKENDKDYIEWEDEKDMRDSIAHWVEDDILIQGKKMFTQEMLIKPINNYRYNSHCPNCGKFKSEGHKCDALPRIGYRCGRCKKYLPYEQFQKDSTKRFGINTRCKQCRKETGNGNKKITSCF